MSVSGDPQRQVVLSEARRLLGEQLRLHPGPFAVSLVGAVVFAGATVLSTEVLGYVTDDVIYPIATGTQADGAGEANTVLWGCLAVVAVAVLRSAGVISRRYYAGMTSERVQATFRNRLTDHYLDLPLSWHQQTPTGQLLAHADNDTERMADVLHPLPLSLGTMFLALFSSISLLLVDVTLALVGFGLFPLLFVMNRLFSARVGGPAAAAQAEVGAVSSIAHESFDGALIVKTLGRAEAEGVRFAEAADRLRDWRVRIGYLRAAFESAFDALPNLGIVLVLIIGAYRVDAGAVTRGDLVQVASLFTVLAFPMRVFGFFLEMVPQSVVSRERLDMVFDEPIPDALARQDRLPDSALGVEVAGLGYRYGQEPPVLSGIDLTIEPGEILALVGSTGAGKSTLCTLLAGLVSPTSGRITVIGDGSSVDLETVSDEDRSEAIALVFQETFLFGASIRENIDLEESADIDDIRHAASVARILGFIDSLPLGFDTVVGERGVTLSGGQRQRVALARALIRRPRLLLLDDATSAVDPKVEQEILARLRAELATTTVVVAQRLATIKLADRVVYLADGAVAATGTHEELLKIPEYEALVMAYEMVG